VKCAREKREKTQRGTHDTRDAGRGERRCRLSSFYALDSLANKTMGKEKGQKAAYLALHSAKWGGDRMG